MAAQDDRSRRKAEAFRLSRAGLGYILNGLTMVHHGLWLGILDRESLNDLTRRFYESGWQPATSGYLESGLKGWEAQAVDRHFGQCRSILVAAAGSGREVIALSERGFDVEAFDCSRRLVDEGRRVLAERGLSARLALSHPDEVPEGLGTYDGVILGWGAYSHIVGRPGRVALLRALRSHLRDGGPLLLSFIVQEPASSGKVYRGAAAIGRMVRWLRRSSEPIEVGDTIPGAFFHRFTRDEVERELNDAGFRLVAYADTDYGSAVATPVSPS